MKGVTCLATLAFLASCSTPEPLVSPLLANEPPATPSESPAAANTAKGAAEKGLQPKTGEEGASVKPATVDRSQKFEIVDLYVDPASPDDQRQLAPYLLKAVEGEWMLVKFEYRSPTQRYYRFQRIARSDGTALPQVDPLLPPK